MFENRPGPGNGSILALELRIYSFLEKEKMVWQQVIDMDSGLEYLMVQVRPGIEEQILGKLMGQGLPEYSVYYVYKAYEV